MGAAHADVPVVLITGCSSGFGRAGAAWFGRKGFRVFASMRRPEDGAALRAEAAAAGWALETPALDVTDDRSVDAAVGAILEATGGRIDVLINNAGYMALGPLEEVSAAELAAQLDTNVVGLHRVTRAVLPAMRARGTGRVVNLSSVSGRSVVPITGAYHASKFAVEALSECLRLEVAPFGIEVAVLEPGPFRTDLYAKQRLAAAAGREDSPYAALLATFHDRHATLGLADLDTCIEALGRAATARHPALRWPVGRLSLLGTLGRRLAPDGLVEALLRLVFRLRRPD